MKKETYDVVGMHCVSCSIGISKILKRTKGVQDVEVELSNSKITVTYEEDKVSDKTVIEQVSRLGYKAIKQEK